MKVRIDGKEVEREHYIRSFDSMRMGGEGLGHCFPQEEPELEEDEQVFFMLGDPVPVIIKTCK